MKRDRYCRAFSLIELIAVIAIILILLAFVVPSLQSVTLGSNLTRSGQIVNDQFALAGQEATGRNRDVQIRFYYLTEKPNGYRAIQLWVQSATNLTEYRPLDRMLALADGTLISGDGNLSPMIANASLSAKEDVPGKGLLDFKAFRFRPGGGTDLKFDGTNDFLTIVPAKEAAATSLPRSYLTVQVDPVNGRPRVYRP